MELRNEIVESQKIRADFLKWKLIIVATIGAAGLGLGSYGRDGDGGDSTMSKPEYLLCIVPFVCAYTDLLCRHLSVRILIIGAFIKHAATMEIERRYEDFVYKLREMANPFTFEDIALQWSSILLSIFVLLYPKIKCYLESNCNYDSRQEIVFAASGGIGLLLILSIWWMHEKRIKKIHEEAKKLSN